MMPHIRLAASAASAITITALSMTACAPGPDQPSPSPAPSASLAPGEADTCNRTPLEQFVGKPVTTEGVPASSPAVRHIYPDTMVTMDYRPDRLNIELTKEGTIVKFKCG